MSTDAVLKQVRAQQQAAMDEMRADLTRQLYATEPFYTSIPPLRRTPRWLRAWYSLRSYVRTLGWALRGESLHKDSECYYDDY